VHPRRWNRPAPVGERKSGIGGGAESGGWRAEFPLPPTPHTSWGSASVCPFNPQMCRSGPRGWWRTQFFAGQGRMGDPFRAVFCPQPTNWRLFCGLRRFEVSARVALNEAQDPFEISRTFTYSFTLGTIRVSTYCHVNVVHCRT
jgi:hypothetical protein